MKKILEPYKMDYVDCLKHFDSSSAGLNDDTVEKNKKYGKNVIEEAKGKSVFTVFIEQYKNLLVVILIVAAILSIFTGGLENAIVIILVITINALLGTWEYFKAEKSLKSLKKLSNSKVKVIRNGVSIIIDSTTVVCGDILVLESGDIPCADSRIISSTNLEVDESSLTGESTSVSKNSRTITQDAPLGERSNILFRGTKVIGGKALACVYSVGMNTEIGSIAQMLQSVKKEKSPLEKDIDLFSKELAILIIIICVLVFFMSLYRHITLMDSLMFAISLAVAAIPEALQTIVTIVLAISTEKMAKDNAVVKDIKAIETLGNIDVICTDKTGTLTQNKMEVNSFYYCESELSGNKRLEDSLFKSALILCNNGTNCLDSTRTINTDDAIMMCFNTVMNYEEILRYRENHKPIYEIPFSSKRKMATTVNIINDKKIMFTKGGSDVILDKCLYYNGHIMSKLERSRIIKTINDYSLNGLRVIGVAYKDVTLDKNYYEDELTFLGLVTLLDPLKEGVKEAISDCLKYHVRPIMITGDHLLTAIAIGKKAGLYSKDSLTCTGKELEEMTDDELLSKIDNISIFARVTPSDKIRIVSILQKKGHSVAFLGDGVNDAPALKKADVGVSMGINATDVSKEASDVILMDDNYQTIVKAIKRGRKVYQNIQNAILFLIAGNIAGIFMVIYTTIFNLPIPFAPVHLLFINLINDSLPAIAIGIEERFTSKKELLYPRERKSPLLNKRVVMRIGFEGFIIALVTLASYYYGMNRGIYVSRTMVFVTITIARLFYSFNCRGRISIFRLKKEGKGVNKALVLSIIFGLSLVALLLFIPYFHSLFMIAPLEKKELLYSGVLAFVPVVLIQLFFTIRDIKNSKL